MIFIWIVLPIIAIGVVIFYLFRKIYRAVDFCKGEMKPSTTIHTVQLKNCVVVIKNVPCMKCEQCGEVVLSAATVEKIERILQTVEKAVAEITVVNYPDCAA